MVETIKHYFEAKIACFLFLFFTLWWISIHFYLPQDHILYEFYGLSYGIIALWGGFWGVIVAEKWGGMKSIIGKAIIMLSLGLFAQEFGQVAYSFYIFILHVDVPYPSIGDLGFFGTIPFYIYGAFLLAKTAGVRVSIKSFQSKLQALVIPVVILGIAYFLFLRNYTIDLTKPLETFLSFGYPMGQAIYISIAILTYSLTRSSLGGIMRSKILFIIFAFSVQFFADYVFIYFQDKYYPGSPIDYIYTISYFLMTIGILQFKTVYMQLRRTENE